VQAPVLEICFSNIENQISSFSNEDDRTSIGIKTCSIIVLEIKESS